jgi:subtilisin family serine protease
MLKNLFFSASMAVSMAAFGQDAPPENWYNLDKTTDGVQGLGVEKAYQTVLKGRTNRPIIVAVLDSGVDPNHEDLKDVMWINAKEAAGKPGVDDDGNGYIDDLNGWNFLGGRDGRNVGQQTLELTRVVGAYNKRFSGKNESDLSGDDKKAYKNYLVLLDKFNEKKSTDEAQLKVIGNLVSDLEDAEIVLKKELKKDGYDAADLDKLAKTSDKKLQKAVRTAQFMLENGYAKADLVDAKDHYEKSVKYSYNFDFDPRADIVKDNPENFADRYYGNNDVQGPDATHGTHVAGIIAAKRNNKIGINGVADNVRIMSVRCVPDGDEHDKDVALAIRYAVDNGASIINMSFGKSVSPHKDWVDAAVKYALDNDVLLIHAAGNDANNNDVGGNFPCDIYAKKGLFKPKKAANWVEIGALSWKKGDEQLATFSNFGKKNVDIFSPGVDINSTVPGNKYKNESGTSMASPAAAGVAAMIRSYFPALTAKQVKSIMLESNVSMTEKVKKPGTDDLVLLSDISVTGGVVNATRALELAAKTKGKKKANKAKA